MDKDKTVPKTKMARLGTVTKTALKVAGKQALHKVSTVGSSAEKKQKKESAHNRELAAEILKSLNKLKGAGLKAAQIMSMEADLLPQEMRDEFKKACHQATPLNRAIVRKVIQNELGAPPETLFKSFNLQAFAAASIGQVHKAVTHEGQEVVVKIQYPGIDKAIHQDIGLLKFFLLKLPHPELKKNKVFIEAYLQECEDRFIEEANYDLELAQLQWFKTHAAHDAIITPEPLPELSTRYVLTMTQLDGLHLDDFLKTQPHQDELNHYAQLMWTFFTHHMNTHNRFHADPNPGNFLFLPNGKLGIVDFGCVKQCDPTFPRNLATNVNAICNKDIPTIEHMYKHNWKLMSEDTSIETIQEKLSFFWDWIRTAFKPKTFDFGAHPHHMKQRLDPQFKAAMDIMKEVSHNFAMFDRAYMGLFNLFIEMKAVVDVRLNFPEK